MLEINDLVVNYGDIQALHSISLHVKAHETVALIGRNGAGKTTTLKAISGLVRCREGTIKFENQDITNQRPHQIARLGIIHIPEGRRIYYKLSVQDNLKLGAFFINDKEKVKQNLEVVLNTFPILAERLHQPGGTLSGGEQQMLAVGRAIMASPRLLLMDEPSLGLAPLLVDLIAEKINEISKLGIPILLIEQNARLALEIAHRAYVIETGSIEMEGDAKEMANDPMIKKSYLGID